MRQRSALALILLALSAPALAQGGAATARSVDDCESLQGFDEYNRCLARFGPPATAIGAGTARPPRGTETGPEAATSSAVRQVAPAEARRVRGGRKSASFAIVSGRARPARPATGKGRTTRRRR